MAKTVRKPAGFSAKWCDDLARPGVPCTRCPAIAGYRPPGDVLVSHEVAFRLATANCNPKRAEMLVLRLVRDHQLTVRNLAQSLYAAAAGLGG